jgi:hypothetical protein
MTKSKRNKVIRKAYRSKNGLLKEEVREFSPSLVYIIFTSRMFLLSISVLLFITLVETIRL